jgi:hypothetical protein
VSRYSVDFEYRASMSVDVTGGTGIPATIDATIPIPSDWDHLWTNVRPDGNDVIAVLSDGLTLATFDITGWSVPNRTGTIRVDALAVGNDDATQQLFLDYGNPNQTVSLQSAVAIAAPKPGVVTLLNGRTAPRVIRVGPEEDGASVPRNKVVTSAGETRDIWWDLSRQLTSRRSKHNGSLRAVEVDWVQFAVTLAGVDQPALYDEPSTRLVDQGLVRTRIVGPGTDDDYTLALDVRLTDGEHLQPRALWRVQTVDEIP